MDLRLFYFHMTISKILLFLSYLMPSKTILFVLFYLLRSILKNETIIRTGIRFKKIPCYMQMTYVKNFEILLSSISHY